MLRPRSLSAGFFLDPAQVAGVAWAHANATGFLLILCVVAPLLAAARRSHTYFIHAANPGGMFY